MFAFTRRPRRTVIATAALLAAATLALTGSATATTTAPTSAACNLATLRGTYLFAGDGWSVSGSGAVPLAFAGSERFDGAGGVQGTSSTNVNGAPSSHNTFTGSYTVAADCTATLIISGTLHFDLYLDPTGDGFAYVQTDPGSVSATTEQRAIRH